MGKRRCLINFFHLVLDKVHEHPTSHFFRDCRQVQQRRSELQE